MGIKWCVNMSDLLDPHGDLSNHQYRACRTAIREGSKSFYAASLVLPFEVRSAASALYAFCRVSDDIADDPRANSMAIQRLKARLHSAYCGQTHPHVADVALSKVVKRYEIPQIVLDSMLEGFEWDVSGRTYETLEEVLDYSARVAGTVGVMMAIIMNRRAARTLARACDLGIAMQLTNIARDVGEDARNGRLYLPRQWLREEGIDPDAFLDQPHFTPALGRVIERLLNEADIIYKRSLTGVTDLPFACRPGIRAAGLVYAEIGAQIRKNGFDSVTQRAFTGRAKKLSILATAVFMPSGLMACDTSPAIRETRYLVQATVKSGTMAGNAGERLLDIVARLNNRDMMMPQSRIKRVGRSIS